MARHRSPFSIGQRKTVVISSSDPRSLGLEDFRSKLGSDVKVKNIGKPLKFLKSYWMESYNSSTTSQSTSATIGNATAGTVDGADNFIVGGYTLNGNSTQRGTLLSISASKNINWQKRFDDFNQVLDIATDSTNNIYILITKTSSTYPYLIKYDASGTLLWQSAIAAVIQNSGTTSSITIDSSDNPIFAVRVTASTTFELVVKLNKTNGSILWQKKIERGSFQAYTYFRITSDIDGNIYFVATESRGLVHYVGKLLSSTGAYDTSFKTTGLAAYAANVGSMTGIGIDKTDTNKNIYTIWSGLTSLLDPTTAKDVVSKYDSSGNLQWSKGIQLSSGFSYAYRTSSPIGKLSIKNNNYYYETSVTGNWQYFVNGNVADGSPNGYVKIENGNTTYTNIATNLIVPNMAGSVYGAGRYQGIETNSSGSIVSARTRLMAFKLPLNISYNQKVPETSTNPAIKVSFKYTYTPYTVVTSFSPTLTSDSGLPISTTAYSLYTAAPLTETNLNNLISFAELTVTA